MLIVGASARAAAFSALRVGILPVAADLFADTDLAARCCVHTIDDYPGQLLRIFNQVAEIPWMYTGALENFPDHLSRLEATRPLLGNSSQVVRRVRCPHTLYGVLRRCGLPALAVRTDARGLPRDGTWMCKPYRSAGGRGIGMWNCSAPTAMPRGNTYFQSRAVGPACTAVYVAARGMALLMGVTRQLIGCCWTNAGAWQYAGSLGPLRLAPRHRAAFLAIGDALARCMGLVGLFGVDTVVGSDGVWPVEVNPRYPASVEVLERALSVPALRWHVEACANGSLPKTVPTGRTVAAGKAVLRARADVVVPDAFCSMTQRVQGPWPCYADLPAAGTLVRRGHPVATAFAVGRDAGEVHCRLRRRIRHMERLLVGPTVSHVGHPLSSGQGRMEIGVSG